ncbi:MAG TPA: hypothetical protein VGB69_11165 [Edaphobacter sp.]
MSFDLAHFEAEVALKLIPTEQLPSVAQDALEAGFDGPHVLRMATLEPFAIWEIDQALPPMLAELGCHSIPPRDAAMLLARQRAQDILKTGENPLPSIPYFHRLMLAADCSDELAELGYFEDDDVFFSDLPDENKILARAREALEDLLSPELRERRRAEWIAAWEREQAKAKTEWPYVLNSPTGRALLKERYKEKLVEMRPFVWLELVAWILLGWAFSSWRAAIIGYIVTIPVLFTLPLWGEYRRMKWERRDLLLRQGVPDDQI